MRMMIQRICSNVLRKYKTNVIIFSRKFSNSSNNDNINNVTLWVLSLSSILSSSTSSSSHYHNYNRISITKHLNNIHY